jgi:hypothetical protein
MFPKHQMSELMFIFLKAAASGLAHLGVSPVLLSSIKGFSNPVFKN